MPDLTGAAAYGGEGWSPRTALRDEIGGLWGRRGQHDEWGRLRAVLLHRPGAGLAVPDPDAAHHRKESSETQAVARATAAGLAGGTPIRARASAARLRPGR